METLELDLSPSDGAGLAWLYEHGEVVRRDDAEDAIHLTVRLSPADRARFAGRAG
jgi:GTP-binding protein HflX